MKKNFDTSALRQTAAEIQGATMPKSITPDMVGGLFSALVEKQGEFVDTFSGVGSTIAVTAKCRALTDIDNYEEENAVGATVYVELFAVGVGVAKALPTQEFVANENGEVVFTVPCGYSFAVYSKYSGYSASCQFAYDAGESDMTIDLWNYPIGVFGLGDGCLYRTAEELADDVVNGIAVCTENTSFCIMHRRTENYIPWGRYGEVVPTLPKLYSEDWNEAQAMARADYNGNLNTHKILKVHRATPAATWADGYSLNPNYVHRQYFLPSAGQLYLMYQNKGVIDAMIDVLNEAGYEFDKLDYDYYWSSSQYDEFCAWVVDMGSGYAGNLNKSYNDYVRAVSAFQLY